MIATATILLMTEASALAMTFMEPEKSMNARFDAANQCVRGSVFMKTEDIDGTELAFTLHNEGDFEKNYAALESVDGQTVYLTFPVGRGFHVEEIRTESPKRIFWLVRAGRGISTETFETTYLIGRSGDTYVNYVTLDDLRTAGLSGNDVWWTVEDGKLIVKGWKRNRQLDEIHFFWDEEKEWLGIQYDSPGKLETGYWFYTDENGESYYLRQFHKADDCICGKVIQKNADGKKTPLLYYVYTDQDQRPYTIYDGVSFKNPGDAIECGCLYDGSEANPSVLAFFEKYLYNQAKARAAAEKRSAS